MEKRQHCLFTNESTGYKNDAIGCDITDIVNDFILSSFLFRFPEHQVVRTLQNDIQVDLVIKMGVV